MSETSTAEQNKTASTNPAAQASSAAEVPQTTQASSSAAGAAPESAAPSAASTPAVAASTTPAPEKKPYWTWDRSIDVLKIVATVWVAAIGSVVTMQFNERQHELNRIEAIAQMLPHMSEEGKNGGKPNQDHLGRDGAIWAIFRTANNRKMLRDLAALFPEDIYRVVSSIALGGELERDPDAIVALEVSSEKLASQYSADPKRAEIASKLYAQALALQQRSPDDTTPLRVLDLTSTVSDSAPTDDQLAGLIRSINDLADHHLSDIEAENAKQKSSGTHWESKQLYLRAERLGASNKDDQVLQQVERADLALASLYIRDQLADDAYHYLKKALDCESEITGKPASTKLKELDKDGDGFAALSEMTEGVKLAQARLLQINKEFKDKGAELNPQAKD